MGSCTGRWRACTRTRGWLAPPGTALAQLRERDYAAKYRGGDEPIHLIGVEFSRDTRNVTAFEVAAG